LTTKKKKERVVIIASGLLLSLGHLIVILSQYSH